MRRQASCRPLHAHVRRPVGLRPSALAPDGGRPSPGAGVGRAGGAPVARAPANPRPMRQPPRPTYFPLPHNTTFVPATLVERHTALIPQDRPAQSGGGGGGREHPAQQTSRSAPPGGGFVRCVPRVRGPVERARNPTQGPRGQPHQEYLFLPRLQPNFCFAHPPKRGAHCTRGN